MGGIHRPTDSFDMTDRKQSSATLILLCIRWYSNIPRSTETGSGSDKLMVGEGGRRYTEKEMLANNIAQQLNFNSTFNTEVQRRNKTA
jgi:hypothetical protein